MLGPNPRDLEQQPLSREDVDHPAVDGDPHGLDVSGLTECVVDLVQSTKHRRGSAATLVCRRQVDGKHAVVEARAEHLYACGDDAAEPTRRLLGRRTGYQGGDLRLDARQQVGVAEAAWHAFQGEGRALVDDVVDEGGT